MQMALIADAGCEMAARAAGKSPTVMPTVFTVFCNRLDPKSGFYFRRRNLRKIHQSSAGVITSQHNCCKIKSLSHVLISRLFRKVQPSKWGFQPCSCTN
jgi:hypothetical protein